MKLVECKEIDISKNKVVSFKQVYGEGCSSSQVGYIIIFPMILPLSVSNSYSQHYCQFIFEDGTVLQLNPQSYQAKLLKEEYFKQENK